MKDILILDGKRIEHNYWQLDWGAHNDAMVGTLQIMEGLDKDYPHQSQYTVKIESIDYVVEDIDAVKKFVVAKVMGG